ncbi:GAF domain-containing protein [Paraburkholderia sp. GAS448]|uniref:GAF domain-containing protein n=1 Tax=Paraburkholderia sp. GAS448 TaxID=3035136 RepID=UPI003D21063B
MLGSTPRDYGPCGTVLDRNSTLLFSNPHLYYPQFAGVLPLLVEGLLVPFHVDGQAVGTVWVVAHDETRKFDSENQRMLESLATFETRADRHVATDTTVRRRRPGTTG